MGKFKMENDRLVVTIDEWVQNLSAFMTKNIAAN